jgi:hypothetical protein
LRYSRLRQLETYDRDNPDYSERRALIRPEALQAGFKDLSKARLEDTILAEFCYLRPVVEALEGRSARLTRTQLAGWLGADPSSADFRAIVESLAYCGVTGQVVRVGGRFVQDRV